jgi:spore coat polysaccharide biosynthesis predicted glycosyltransferase SpsG
MLRVTESFGDDITINAVVGPYFTPPDGTPDDVIFHRQPPAIHELMWAADIAVSGGGQTLYELAVCGTPAVALTLGPDQKRNINGFAEAGFCLPAGAPDEITFEKTLRDQVQTLLESFEIRKQMYQTGIEIVDGRGVVRVADRLLNL